LRLCYLFPYYIVRFKQEARRSTEFPGTEFPYYIVRFKQYSEGS